MVQACFEGACMTTDGRRTVRRLALALFTSCLAAVPAQAFQIVRFSPQGEVSQVRQVVVRFDEPATRFGDARAPAPLALRCDDSATSQGTGRWNNEREWVFEFARDLPPGVRCTAQPEGPLSAVSGQALKGQSRFAFSTGGPFVSQLHPGYGSVDEDQVFVLQLNGPATLASVAAHVWCQSDSLGERIPVKLVDGRLRDEVLRHQRLDRLAAREPLRVVTLACQRTLTPGSKGQLVFGAGVATPSGVLNKVEKRLDFQVREPFSASFSCERENAQAACLPLRPMRLAFSAPVARAAAQAIVLKSGTQRWRPDFGEDGQDGGGDRFVSSVRFQPLFPEQAQFTLELPKDLRDDAGRTLRNADQFPLQLATAAMPPLAKFAAAPFGIVERFAEPGLPPLLPITLRKVEGLPPAQALQVGGGRVNDLQPQSDADIIAWLQRVKRYDSFFVPRPQAARDVQGALPPPIGDNDQDAVQSRMVSLLQGRAGVQALQLPAPQAGDPRPFEVVGIPLAPGFHVLEVASARLGAALLDEKFGTPRPFYVRTSVLVTNLGVHFKLGRDNAMAWVTTLDKGQPVTGARVQVSDCRGRPVASGTTNAQGVVYLDKVPPEAPRCVGGQGAGDGDEDYRNAWFVSARQRGADGVEDLAFAWSDWQRGIEPWRFNVPTSREATPDVRVHTVLDRKLLRAGETVSMKHLMRLESRTGFTAPPPGPGTLTITHTGTGQTYRQPLAWRKTATGGLSAESSWQIPPGARLGSYDLTLSQGDGASGRSWGSGSFRVEEFRLPVLQGRVAVAGKGPLVDVRQATADVQLHYLSGGAAAQLPVRVSALVRARPIAFSDFDDYSFNPPRQDRNAVSEALEEEASASQDQTVVANRLPATLDKNGTAQVVLPKLPASPQPQDLLVEASYNDPNGEVQTLRGSSVLWPASLLAGIKAESWTSVKQKAVFQAVALDLTGKPQADVRLAVTAVARTVTSSRKRLVGGFYSYDNQTTLKPLGTVCSGRSDARGLLACEARIEQPGEIELVVTATDHAGRAIQAATSIWVTRQDEQWFGGDNHDRMDVLAEKKHYEPGETARFQVRMPFRHATALVAIEREGVIATRIVELNGRDPGFDLAIEPGWAPNVYVSVLALRGRLREVPWYSFFTWGFKAPREWWTAFWHEGREYVAPTALVDLAKPAYRLGMAEIRVGQAAHQLKVAVKADRESYPVRGQAQVTVSATRPDGKPAANAEVALAAVDQALEELSPNTSWNLLEAMLQRRAWGVETSTAQMEIIGRRHYGRKAVAAGGGGGRAPTRELLDTLLLWNPRLQLDANGQARVTVPLNDALTSFKIVAVADAGATLFGTGQTLIRATQDLQLISGLPPLVREDDRFRAQVTLRNTTSRAMKVEVTPRATLLDPPAPGRPKPASTPLGGSDAHAVASAGALYPQTVDLAAGASTEVAWTVTAPAQLAFTRAESILWEIQARELLPTGASGPPARDALKASQRIVPAVPVTVQQATLVQLDGPFSLPVQAPPDTLALDGVPRGGLKLNLQPRLADGLPGVRDWFLNYPFTCLEQKASKAIGLRDAKLWQALASQLPSYLDGDGLAHYFPPSGGDSRNGSDTLTAHLLAASAEASALDPTFTLPAESRSAMARGLIAFVEGRISRNTWSPRKDLDQRKLAAIAALARHGQARAGMLASLTLAPNQWPTDALLHWVEILKRVADVPQRDERLKEAMQVLRGRLSFNGTRLGFSTEADDHAWWLMSNPDTNAARLMLAVLDDPGWKDDMGRLATGLLARQQRGAWGTTTANLWGSLAIKRFSKRFESTTVTGSTRAANGAATVSADWAKAPAPSLVLPWAKGNPPDRLTVAHQGSGKPWLTLQSLAAVPVTAPFSAGYQIRKTLTPVEQAVKGRWRKGDVVRVALEVTASADMTWVVVSDPIPGGATLLGSGLGRDSGIATASEKRPDGVWPTFEERSFEAWRGYYAFLPKGTVKVEYTVRLNNAGDFALPPTRAEAMYAPEVHGVLPNARFQVENP